MKMGIEQRLPEVLVFPIGVEIIGIAQWYGGSGGEVWMCMSCEDAAGQSDPYMTLGGLFCE